MKARTIVSVEKGGGPCRTDCPFYSESGWVKGVLGVPLKTHCRATMEPISVDCDIFNSMTVEKMEVTSAEWEAMQAAIGKEATKERKPYPDDHKEIHPVGWSWTHDRFRTGASQPCGDKWRAEKSASVKPCRDTAIPGFRGSVKH